MTVRTVTLTVDIDDTDAATPAGRRAAAARIQTLALLELVSHAADLVIAAAAAEHDVTVEQLLGTSQHRRIAMVRQQVMSELIEAGLSSTQAGAKLNRDHSTVLHGARAHRRRREAAAVTPSEDPPATPAADVPHCEQCNRPSLGGGRWCLNHFRDQVQARGAA